eukprot:scaffold30792_cov63-Phaeocystis_antarctica.AAC.15
MLIYYRTSNHNIDTVAPLPVAAEPRLPLPFGSGHVLPLPLTGPPGPNIQLCAGVWRSSAQRQRRYGGARQRCMAGTPRGAVGVFSDAESAFSDAEPSRYQACDANATTFAVVCGLVCAQMASQA